MTSRPVRSHVLHSGFVDLVDLISHTTSKLGVQVASSRFLSGLPSSLDTRENRFPGAYPARKTERQDQQRRDSKYHVEGIPYEQTQARSNVDPNAVPRGDRAGGQGKGKERERDRERELRERQKISSMAQAHMKMPTPLKYRKVDKREIGPPMDFR